MTPRKPELLDLLRKQTGSSSASQGKKPFRKAAAPAPSQPAERSNASQRLSPWLPAAVLLVVVAGGLLFWGPSWFTPADPVEARTPPVTVEAPVVVEQPKPEPLPPTPSVPVEVAPPAFAVKVITYTYNSRNQKLAVATATALRKRGLPGVQALVRPPVNPKHIEIYVGSASSKLELASQRGRIRALEYPEGSGEKPFASATIDSLPVTQNP